MKYNVLVITLDTIRADRLGAYGNRSIRSDFVDGLAERGVLFEHCIVPTPLTLPSHTSLFTGTYPPHHGVRDNGNYVVPGELTTMAELFRDAGYRTGAFVGAFVLSSRWGLDQGFETYTEPASGYDPSLASFAQIQRRADAVVDDATAWIRESSDRPFFAWVHVYDPHLPYDPPPVFAAEYAEDPYLGEVAFADAELGRLQALLDLSGLAAKTIVVFAGDHGEGLGDHDELDHGLLLYQTTLRAPLIIAHPAVEQRGVRREEVVSLVDILPTLAAVVDLPIPERVQGQSLLPLMDETGEFEERPVYSETHYPKLHFGWSPLTALQDRRFQLIQSSDPELYDLAADPKQQKNLFDTNTAEAEGMGRELARLTQSLAEGGVKAAQAPDAETIAKLAALGYVTGGGVSGQDPADGDLPSPRSMLWIYNMLMEASGILASGDEIGAERKFLEILEAEDNLVDAWLALGRLYRRQGRMAEALDALREAHERRPLDPFVVSKLADALISTRQPAEAEELLRVALEEHPDDPYIVFALARALESFGRLDEAETMYRKSHALDPRSAPTHVRLAALALRRGDRATAESELDTALQLDPKVPEASLYKGQLLESAGRLDEAAVAYRNEIRSSPNNLPAAIALSRLEGRRGNQIEQERVLRDAVAANPRSPGPYLVLSMTFFQRGERYEEAVELAELALAQKPEGQELQMAYFLLANLHNRLGNAKRSAEYVELGGGPANPLEGNRGGESPRR